MPQKTLVTFFTAENFKIPKLLKIKNQANEAWFFVKYKFLSILSGSEDDSQ